MTTDLKDYQRAFLQFAIDQEALRFGEFTLKSGRLSPYFFNTGLFSSGDSLARLGEFYAQAILDAELDFDMLYGPAYKGIPLAAAVAIALAQKHGRDLPFAFNRKEAKDHGEGGNIVGAPLQGRVLIIDDVISAGISVGESIRIIKDNHATPAGVVISLDRMEQSRDAKTSAAMEVSDYYGLPVENIVNLDDLIAFLGDEGEQYREHLEKIEQYRAQYGA